MATQSPTTVSSTTFKIVKKGYDPDEVRAYLKEVAAALQSAQDHAANVEARARQAVARAQEQAQAAQAQATAAASTAAASQVVHDDTETISRTLLLAQKTADETVAAAAAEAEAMRAAASTESEALLAEARAEVATASDTARLEARRAGESERLRVDGELQQLLARLEFLRDDVTQMEAHSAHHRERLLQVAEELQQIASRQSAGLGENRRPVLSAASDLDGRDIGETQPIAIVSSEPAVSLDWEPDDAEAEHVAEPDPAAAWTVPDPASDREPMPERSFGRLFSSEEPAPATTTPVDLDITAEVPITE